MIFFACVVCKATHCLLRLFNFGATSLPGALALKICPDILGYAAKNVDIIAVTGTNGKTTSARIIERALQNAGRSVCANRSGANLMPGITAELIMNKSLFGSIRCESAVIECDEAACRLVLGRLRPRVLLITNLFRDQLDRYGTVTYPRDCIAEGLRDTPETIAVINADCPMAASVSRLCQNKTVYYGLGEHKKTCVGSGEDDTCPVCGKRLGYKGFSYANLGVFSCSCGFARSKPDVSAESVFPDGSFVLRADGDKTVCAPALPGLYNVYNSVGAVAAYSLDGTQAYILGRKNDPDRKPGFLASAFDVAVTDDYLFVFDGNIRKINIFNKKDGSFVDRISADKLFDGQNDVQMMPYGGNQVLAIVKESSSKAKEAGSGDKVFMLKL